MRSAVVVLLLFSLVAVCWAGAFSQAEKNNILNCHNVLRAQIARGVFKAKTKVMPPAKNMYKLIWDNGLEAAAQAHANKCIWQHSTNRVGVGENMAMQINDANTFEKKGGASTNMWWREFQDIGWASLNLTMAAFNSGIGHASQNAWATTRMIGCGAQFCNNKSRIYVICQYKKAGNYINTNIYAQGPKCSACPAGTKCVPTGLMAGLCA